MLCHCDEMLSQINPADCKRSLALGDGALCLYVGESADKLSALGYRNMIVRDKDGLSSGWPLKSIRNADLIVKHQEAMKELNASPGNRCVV